MKVVRNPAQLQVKRGGATDFICPNCGERHLYVASIFQKNVVCPGCFHKWRVDLKGRP